MKLALIYNSRDTKLLKSAYSQTYRDMFMALYHRFEDVHPITENCSAKDIEADCILFFDVHSSHPITIDGLKEHPAVKYEYINDPHQQDQICKYPGGITAHKLGAQQRVQRMRDRGIHYIICPYKDGYYRWLAPYVGSDADDMLVWYPVSPNQSRFTHSGRRLSDRKNAVLANGATWEGKETWGYDFRRWAFSRENVYLINHCIINKNTPQAIEYPQFLAKFTAVLALTGIYVVPKYLEIPLAGCICLAQYLPNYDEMGFKDKVHCLFVDKDNFDSTVKDVKNDPTAYQGIADAGRKLVESKYTSRHFADYIYHHAEKQCAVKP